MAIAVSAPSLRKPGSGFAPCEIGSPALRPFGVAPTVLPKRIVSAHVNHPGMSLKPCGVVWPAISPFRISVSFTAHASARVPPAP